MRLTPTTEWIKEKRKLSASHRVDERRSVVMINCFKVLFSKRFLKIKIILSEMFRKKFSRAYENLWLLKLN